MFISVNSLCKYSNRCDFAVWRSQCLSVSTYNGSTPADIIWLTDEAIVFTSINLLSLPRGIGWLTEAASVYYCELTV